MKPLVLTLAICLVSLPAAAQSAMSGPSAQPAMSGATTNPISTAVKRLHDGVKRNVIEAADKMPEANYAFKPTPDVRNFGELIGHIANAQFSYCSAAKGDKNPNEGNDFEKKTAKADLVKGLADSYAYCDAVYAGATDAMMGETIKMGQTEAPRASRLIGNVSHINEHYGNIVTYMRLKKLVPPSTERSQQPRRTSGQ